MTTFRVRPTLARAAAGLATLAAAAAPLAAQSNRPLFNWSGQVDREVVLVMRGRGVDSRYGAAGDRGRVRVGSALPRTTGYVNVQVSRGRGSVDVVQQPNARNDYTAIVRLRDDQAGAGDYQVTAVWRGNDGEYGRDDRRGDGRGRAGRDNGGDGRDDDGRNDRDNGTYDDRNTSNGTSRGGWGGILGRVGGGTSGNSTGTLRWSGRVDDVQDIRIRGRRASAYTVSGNSATDVRTSVSGSGLPASNVTVRLRAFDGRGTVRVVEQPSARNDYTAVVRVEDRQGGTGFYDFEASWY